VHGQTFNVGFDNMSVAAIAELVKKQIGDPSITIKVEPTNDLRSYHVNSDKIFKVLGFKAKRTLQQAVQSLVDAYRAGKIKDALANPVYYNIKVMQQVNIKKPLLEVVHV
jgi:nucleoside-diphosphate-sugar epimerase